MFFQKLFSGFIFGGVLGQMGRLLDRQGRLEAAQIGLEGVECATEVAVSDLQLLSIVLYLRLAGQQAEEKKIHICYRAQPGILTTRPYIGTIIR
jgi:hypothetical protein